MYFGRPDSPMIFKVRVVKKLARFLKLGLSINQSVCMYNIRNKEDKISKDTIYSWYSKIETIRDLIDSYKDQFKKKKENI